MGVDFDMQMLKGFELLRWRFWMEIWVKDPGLWVEFYVVRGRNILVSHGLLKRVLTGQQRQLGLKI